MDNPEQPRFFPPTVKREMTLKGCNLLISAAGETRIKITLQMPLSGRSLVGAPGWLGDALTYVSKTRDTANLKDEFASVNLAFCLDDLFNTQIKAPGARLKSFVVKPTGSSENPDVDLFFVAYCSFSHDLWNWCGEKRGFWATFEVNAFEEDAEGVEDD